MKKKEERNLHIYIQPGIFHIGRILRLRLAREVNAKLFNKLKRMLLHLFPSHFDYAYTDIIYNYCFLPS